MIKAFRRSSAIVLGGTLLVGACASELPDGAPPVDPYGPPTAMNSPDRHSDEGNKAETPPGDMQAGEASVAPSDE